MRKKFADICVNNNIKLGLSNFSVIGFNVVKNVSPHKFKKSVLSTFKYIGENGIDNEILDQYKKSALLDFYNDNNNYANIANRLGRAEIINGDYHLYQTGNKSQEPYFDNLSIDVRNLSQGLTEMVNQWEEKNNQLIPRKSGSIFIELSGTPDNLEAKGFDLNKFKPINDKFGHAEGDRALIVFANILRKVFRESDVFGRLGGDEFAVLMMDVDAENTQRVIQRFNSEVTTYNQEAARGYDIEYSVGFVNSLIENNIDVNDLLAAADKEMYAEKGNKVR